MKARIINGRFDSIYLDEFLQDGWVLTDVLPTEEELKYISLMFDFSTNKYYEGATTEEIAEVAYQIEIESAKSFMEQKENDGCSFYKEIDLKMTIALSKIERKFLFEILNEVDNVLYPPLMKIKTGDFASALFIFSNQQAPTTDFVLDFYNEAVSYCQNYYNTKYPIKK